MTRYTHADLMEVRNLAQDRGMTITTLQREVERLREVERAARAYVSEFDHLIGDYPESRELREALAK